MDYGFGFWDDEVEQGTDIAQISTNFATILRDLNASEELQGYTELPKQPTPFLNKIWEEQLIAALQERAESMNTTTITRNHIVAAIENLALALKGAELTRQTQAAALIESNIRTLSATLNDLDERVKALEEEKSKLEREQAERQELIDQLEARYSKFKQVYWNTKSGILEDITSDMNEKFQELLDAIRSGFHDSSERPVAISEVRYLIENMD